MNTCKTKAVINRCQRCGIAYRHYPGDGLLFCSIRCGEAEGRADLALHKRPVEGRPAADSAMMPRVLEHLAEQRPSYVVWKGGVA